MRLTATKATPETDLERAVGEVLDRRLQRDHPRPAAVALSGGGDSLALLLAARAWARQAKRPLVVLTVDHRLRPESADWTQTCAATAERLGLAFRALAWAGAKPTTGLPAAARAARHCLLAEAAREAGARVILMGHTADDLLEAAAMRTAGSTTPDPREWAPSPVWPEGRGIFLLRPLLALRRGDLRDWLAARGETWLDDPANEDMAYARPRARRSVGATGAPVTPPAEADRSAAALAVSCRADASGGLSVDRAALRAAAAPTLQRFIAAACLCAAGTDRPPASRRVMTLAARLTGADAFAATLAGARVEADETRVRFLREAGEAARGGLAPLRLEAGDCGVWDGRFEVSAERALEIRAASGLRAGLTRAEQAALAALSPSARAVVPVTVDDAGHPALAAAVCLALDRLLAACGAVEREPA